jgi:hypothetical protein
MTTEPTVYSAPRATAWRAVCVALAAAALAFGVFVWPTPWRYEKVNTFRGDRNYDKVYRINRWTGDAVPVIPPRTAE